MAQSQSTGMAGAPAPTCEATTAQRTKALVFASLGFMLTFWAWSLISPLGPQFVSDGLAEDSALIVGGFVAFSVYLPTFLSNNYDLEPTGASLRTAGFIIMSAGLGAGAGTTFALVAEKSGPAKVGSITGFVGASGGLGGFVPPLLLGALWTTTGTYTLGLILLAAFTVIAGLITLWLSHDAKKNLTATIKEEQR